ncbi:MAG: hypothetical protein H6728_13925 [Myxococcales bacterium]|nr:hypothetical protein [Myxococcales bacterium]MCB9644169.1 hypothetical protein [Myxococcales bacterium]
MARSRKALWLFVFFALLASSGMGACFVVPVDTTCRPCSVKVLCGEGFACTEGRCQSAEAEAADCSTWEPLMRE